MIIRTPRRLIEQYFADEAINQSALKVILFKGYHVFAEERAKILSGKEDQYEEKAHFVIGNGVDVEMTEGREQFDLDHHLSDLESKPSDTMKKVLHIVLNTLTSNNIDPRGRSITDFPDAVHFALNNVEVPDKEAPGGVKIGYYMNRAKPNYTEDKRLEDVFKSPVHHLYWEDIGKALGKQVLTRAEKGLIDTMCTNLREHRHTANLFLDRSNVITVYQYPIYFQIGRVMCKVLIDKMDIHLDTGFIYVQDLKTMRGPTLMFPQHSVLARRYDFQIAFYVKGVEEKLHELSAYIGYDVTNFHVANPQFIVESTTHPGCPLVYDISDDLMRIGKDGDERYRGYMDGLREYEFWKTNDFNPETAVSATNGRLMIGGDFKHHLI